MEELISRKKLIQDLNAVREVLSAQGDPFLAAMMTRAIGVVENQPVVRSGADLVEVTRCAECQNRGKFCLYSEGFLMCPAPPDDFYCAKGKRNG